MSMSERNVYVRIQSGDRDPSELLDPARQTSSIWCGWADKQCPDCNGDGHDFVWLDAADDDMTMVRCETCVGTGRVDDTTRPGVSACETLDALYSYFAGRAADLEGAVVITMEADLAGEADWDEAEGAVLVRPTRIVGVEPVDMDRIRECERLV